MLAVTVAALAVAVGSVSRYSSRGVGRCRSNQECVRKATVNPSTLLGTMVGTLDLPRLFSALPLPPPPALTLCADGSANQRAQGRRRRRPVPGKNRPPDIALLLSHEADVAHEDRSRPTRGRRKVRTQSRRRKGREGARERGDGDA